jgi:cell division septal protein FtsQ
MSLSKEQIENGFKKILYLVLIAGAGFLFNVIRTYVFESDQFFNIKLFDINGTKSLTDRDVISLSELVIGDKLINSEIERAEHNISRSAYIKSVNVRPQLPSTVQIFIEEYIPIAYLRGSSLKLISKNGRILPRPIDLDYQNLPIILLSDTYKLIDGEFAENNLLKDALTILNVSQNVSVDLGRIISEIDCSEKKVNIRLIEGGAKLYVDLENLVSQLLTFDFYLQKKHSIDFIRKLSYIDLRFNDRVITKKRG